MIKEAFGRFGFETPLDAFCSLSVSYNKKTGGLATGASVQDCKNGDTQADFTVLTNDQATLRKSLQDLLKTSPKAAPAAAALDGAEEHIRAYRSFVNECKPSLKRIYTSGSATNNDQAFKLAVVLRAANGAVLNENVYASTDNDHKDGKKIVVVSTTNRTANERTCGQLAQDTVTYAAAYKRWLLNHPDAAMAAYSDANTKDTGDGSESTCVVDGVGWIVCAAANFMAKITDGMYEHIIANMLDVAPLNVDTADGKNGVYNAWAIIRNLANVLFVIAFLIVIYAQITGGGLSNYAIKKLLPRIAISAILVNVSFWIAAIGVDVSNILGSGMYDLLQGVRGNLNVGNINGWAAVTSLLLSGGAIAGTAAGVTLAASVVTPAIALSLLGILLPLLLGALLAIFIVIFILVARQALVVLLIIIAPLAFVAFLLPNTQSWFTKWRQWFISLLMLYPIVSFMVGGSQIAGLVLIGTASSGFTDAIGDTIKIMSGLFVMVVPFFFLPFMIRRFGGAGIDRMAGNLKSMGGKIIQPAGKFARKAGAESMGRQWNRMKAGNTPTYGGNGRFARFRRTIGDRATRGAQSWDQRQARHGMETEQYADQQKDALLERLSTDETFRTAAAGGDATAADRLAARADAQVHERRMKDASAMLRGLTRDERIMLAGGQHVTSATGQAITPDAAMQEAAIRDVASSLDSREALNLADAVGGGHGVDATVRRAAVESLGGKAPQLTGTQLGELENDTYARPAATQAGLNGGKFDAEWMSAKAKPADLDELTAHIAGIADPAEQARLQAIVDDAVSKLDSTDTLRAKVVTGSDLDQALNRLASARSIPPGGSGNPGGFTWR